MTEHSEYFKMLKRMIKGARKRVGQADEVELAEMIELGKFLDDQIKLAVQDQLSNGKSWAKIADATGTSRQAAFKKYSK